MDLLTGYGSASEEEDDVKAPSAPSSRAAVNAAPIAAPTAKPQLAGLLNSLPKPKAALPANFFDSKVDNNAADTDSNKPGTTMALNGSSALPPDFFDSGAAPPPVVPEHHSISYSRAGGVGHAAVQADTDFGVGGACPPSSSAAPSEQQAGGPQLWSKLPAPRTAAAKRKFKEVNADKIKYVDPAQKEAAQGMRAALGTEYAGQLRAQAAPHVGSRLARSKHQIGTLYANAKVKELEMFENRARGMKSKAETAGKYGW
eukprot:gene5355-5591_t